ncbi:MAG: tetratricopeptide repeat protein [Terriglobales bacterium]
MPRGCRLLLWLVLLLCCAIPRVLHAQAAGAGKIVGDVRVLRGEIPDHAVLVSLETRGQAIASTYTDSQGRFGFSDLVGNPYKVTVNDDAYEPFSLAVDVNPASAPMNFVQVVLTPRKTEKKDPLPGRVAGSNPSLVDSAEYNRQFPKKTLKEFEKGVSAEHAGNSDEAIQHYLKALASSPDFYPAHNNLGAAYLSRSDYKSAQSQFEAALKLNQNDGEAYFNLANVCILTGEFVSAQNLLNDGFRKQPDSAFGKFLQGTLNLHVGKLPEAEVALQEAIRLDPAMAQPRLQLINLFLKEGKKPEAVGQLHAFVSAFPSGQFSEQARKLLLRLDRPDTTMSGSNSSPAKPN